MCWLLQWWPWTRDRPSDILGGLGFLPHGQFIFFYISQNNFFLNLSDNLFFFTGCHSKTIFLQYANCILKMSDKKFLLGVGDNLFFFRKMGDNLFFFVKMGDNLFFFKKNRAPPRISNGRPLSIISKLLSTFLNIFMIAKKIKKQAKTIYSWHKLDFDLGLSTISYP